MKQFTARHVTSASKEQQVKITIGRVGNKTSIGFDQVLEPGILEFETSLPPLVVNSVEAYLRILPSINDGTYEVVDCTFVRNDIGQQESINFDLLIYHDDQSNISYPDEDNPAKLEKWYGGPDLYTTDGWDTPFFRCSGLIFLKPKMITN